MSKIEDGGPAFPLVIPPNQDYSEFDRGMSLRDYFAAQAMAAFLGSVRKTDRQVGVNSRRQDHCASAIDFTEPDLEFGDEINGDTIASVAYECAEAMLAARKAGA